MRGPTNRSCPRCGGEDRLFYGSRRQGWVCRQCRYFEPDRDTPSSGLSPTPLRELTPAETEQAHLGYTAAAQWAQAQLWTSDGAAAQAYLQQRGLNEDTIRWAGLGWHPPTWRDLMASAIYHQDKAIYTRLRLSGLTAPQGLPKQLLRDAITLPYVVGGQVRMLRTRKLEPSSGPKYCSPAGVPYFAGGAPIFFGHDLLAQATTLILTEGELKALAVSQAWRAKQLPCPAIAQPGISYLPEALIDALAHKTIILCYDSEARKDPFVLSPGEQFTIRHGARLTGIGLAGQIAALARQAHQAAKAGNAPDAVRLEQQAQQFADQAAHLDELAIDVKVLRLPRAADTAKVDLDSFLLAQGPDALAELIARAQPFDLWHLRHGSTDYRLAQGRIFNGVELANYQAVIVEDVQQHDGLATTAVHRIALRAPSGAQRIIPVEATIWANPKTAMEAIRAGMLEGAADDKGAETLRAIRRLSELGDGPTRREIYTATGWQRLGEHWAYLVPDGAITASGLRSERAELPEHSQGAHYAMCGDGDASAGAAAYLPFLRGAVCPQPLALLLAGHAALSVVHHFLGDHSRPALFLHGESGCQKTSLVRAGLLALFGPKFTAIRGDGAPVPKWDATTRGLEILAFSYRDAPLLIDDFKLSTARPEVLAGFLHNYSEGASRTRMTRDRKADRSYPARCLAVITGEDRPAGDPGQLGRLFLVGMKRGDVDPEALAQLQTAGSAGHLVVWWRGFIQEVARWLDQTGADQVQAKIRALLARDDASLPGHQRTAGALRQHRAAWLLFSHWLHLSGAITADEKAQLDAAHLQARAALAEQQHATQQENRPATIFLQVLQDALARGELVIEHKGMTCPHCGGDLHRAPEGWHCQNVRTVGSTHEAACTYRLDARKVIGFRYSRGVGIFWESAWGYVTSARAQQRQPLQYTAAAVLQQLDADGLIVERDARRIQKLVRNPADGGKLRWVVALGAQVLDAAAEPDPQPEPPGHVTTVTMEATRMVTCPSASECAKPGHVTSVTNVTMDHQPLEEETHEMAPPDPLHGESCTPCDTVETVVTVVTEGGLAHQDGLSAVTMVGVGMVTSGAGMVTAPADGTLSSPAARPIPAAAPSQPGCSPRAAEGAPEPSAPAPRVISVRRGLALLPQDLIQHVAPPQAGQVAGEDHADSAGAHQGAPTAAAAPPDASRVSPDEALIAQVLARAQQLIELLGEFGYERARAQLSQVPDSRQAETQRQIEAMIREQSNRPRVPLRGPTGGSVLTPGAREAEAGIAALGPQAAGPKFPIDPGRLAHRTTARGGPDTRPMDAGRGEPSATPGAGGAPGPLPAGPLVPRDAGSARPVPLGPGGSGGTAPASAQRSGSEMGSTPPAHGHRTPEGLAPPPHPSGGSWPAGLDWGYLRGRYRAGNMHAIQTQCALHRVDPALVLSALQGEGGAGETGEEGSTTA